MRRICCAIVGGDSVFAVEMDRQAEAGDLRRAIFQRRWCVCAYMFDENALELYVAKGPDGAWLHSGSALGELLEQGLPADHGFANMRLMLPLDDETNLGSNFPHDHNEIHVLVQVPLETCKPVYPNSQDAVFQLRLLNEPVLTLARSNRFRKDLLTAYACSWLESKKVRCMMLDRDLQSELVVAAHLLPLRNHKFAGPVMQISDINDTRNGLLLFKPIERAYDKFQLSFIYDETSGEYRLKVIKPNLCKTCLIDELDDKEQTVLNGGRPLRSDWRSGGQIRACGTSFKLLAISTDNLFAS
jgi:hypothetical protein